MKKIDAPDKVIFICDGKKCGRYSKELRSNFKELIKDNNLKKEVALLYMDCTGNCKIAPVISLQPKNIWIGETDERDVKSIFKQYIL